MKAKAKRGRGRPSIGAIRRNISITPEDYETFKEYGRGCISGGIRYAAHVLRMNPIR